MNTTREASGAIHKIGRQLLDDILAILIQEGLERTNLPNFCRSLCRTKHDVMQSCKANLTDYECRC